MRKNFQKITIKYVFCIILKIDNIKKYLNKSNAYYYQNIKLNID